ncbi:sodium channel protein Nach-like [Hetaerina americana]|uniref:sodium channel protein Nach-like n=1 Tax=Hetaerina americana TaxID=62018 RepID=UPI003A7F485D
MCHWSGVGREQIKSHIVSRVAATTWTPSLAGGMAVQFAVYLLFVRTSSVSEEEETSVNVAGSLFGHGPKCPFEIGTSFLFTPDVDKLISIDKRLFWVVVCGVSWYYCSLFMAETWSVYQNNPISFVVETDYLRWNTSFPAVSVCEEDNKDNVFRVVDETFGEDHDYNLDEVFREIAYFRETTYYINEFCTGNLECPQTGLEEIAIMVRSPCDAVFQSCRWNSKPFDCCSWFKAINTEVGTCYTINSVHGSGNGWDHFMVSNRSTGPGTLDIEIKVPSRVYLHSSEEVPFLNSPESSPTASGALITKRFAVHEVRNGEDVEDIEATVRRCKFPWEAGEDSAYDHYSYSACVVQCRVLHEKRECNCTPPLTPGSRPDEVCNMSGMICLSQIIGKLAVLKSEWNLIKNGIYCPCFPSCEEIEIDTIEEYATKAEGNARRFRMIMDRLPSERYLRNVVRGKLDLVVALGGTCGLFAGASLLSAVEFLYYFGWKVWCPGNGKRTSDEREGEKRKKGAKSRARKLALRLRRRKERALNPLVALVTANQTALLPVTQRQ